MRRNGFVFLAFTWQPVISWMCLVLWLSVGSDCLGFQGSPQQVVDDLKSKMASLNGQLTTIEDEINSGEGNLTALQSQYKDVLDELNETIETLKESCLTAISADPKNQKNIQTVMGILLNDADNGDDREVLMACDRLIAADIHPAYFEYAARAGRIKIDAREIFDEALVRLREAKSDDLPRVLIKTNKGDITVELYENQAPQTVANFISLVESGFYDDSLFHSVIESFHAQTGGPTRDDAARKSPGYAIYCECYTPDARPHFTDVLSMVVKSTRDTGGSQFIIALERTNDLDGKYTVFGRIIDGHAITDQWVRTAIEINGEATDIPNANPDYIISAEVIRKRAHPYTFRKVGDLEEEKKTPVPPPAQPETKSFDKEDDTDAPEMTSPDQGEPDSTEASQEDEEDDAAEAIASGEDAEKSEDTAPDSSPEAVTEEGDNVTTGGADDEAPPEEKKEE